MSAIPMHSTRITPAKAREAYAEAVAARAARVVPDDLIAAPAPEYHRPEPVVLHVNRPALGSDGMRVKLVATWYNNQGAGAFHVRAHRPE